MGEAIERLKSGKSSHDKTYSKHIDELRERFGKTAELAEKNPGILNRLMEIAEQQKVEEAEREQAYFAEQEEEESFKQQAEKDGITDPDAEPEEVSEETA